MASQPPPASNYPASMGPGARQADGAPAEPMSREAFDQFIQSRRSYSMEMLPNGIRIGYEIQGQQRDRSYQFENLPLGSLGQWLLYGGQGRAYVTSAFVTDMISGLDGRSKRPLTQTEVDSIALHSSKRMIYQYAGTSSAVVAGAAFTWHGRANMKFPIINARPPERYENFPNRYLPILRGSHARYMWHATRATVWTTCALFVLGPILGSMGGASMVAGLYQDPRTKQLMMDVKPTISGMNRRARNQTQPQPAANQPSTSTADDGSPTSDSFEETPAYRPEEYASMYGQETPEANPDTLSQRQEAPQQTSQSRWGRRPPSQSQNSGPSSQGFFDDDASPTDANISDPHSPTAPYQSASGGGSTWDRIRRSPQAQPQRQPLPSRLPQRSSSSSNDESFSFSGSDSEKQYAKQQAQKEFDDMLERERRESGSGEYARGMEAAGKGSEPGGGGGGGSAWGRRN